MADRKQHFFARLIQMSMKQSYALKASFWMRLVFMIVSDLIMMIGWYVMFESFQTINGWNFNDFMFMSGLNISAFSIWTLFFRGAGIRMSQWIQNGEFDYFLLSPQNVLFHASCCVSEPSGWGDFLAGIGLMIASGLITVSTFGIVVILFICAVLCFLSVNFFLTAINFYFKNTVDLTERLFYVFFSICGYPGSIYTDWAKILLITIFPAGLISILPIEVLKNTQGFTLFYLLGAAITLFFGSILFFYRGLKKYESGNRTILRG